MTINRRDFFLLTATFVAGCSSTEITGSRAVKQRVVNVGPASNYAADGVYAAFSNQGFFIIRKKGELFALSAICTHKRCKLKWESGQSFHCPCHGSTFDPMGHVTLGPAKRDLPVFTTVMDQHGDLLVTVPAG